MANIINRQQTFSTNGTVTAAGLHNLIDTALVNSAIIKNQQEITTIGTADLLLIAPDSVDASLAPRKVTVQNLLDDGLTAGTFTSLNLTGALTYGTATGNRTVSTSATLTTGTIPNLTAGTTTSTAATITNGTIPTLTAGTTTGTAGIFTSGTVATLNSTTGTITNLSTTLAGDFTISQGTGTLGTSGATATTYGTTSAIPRITVDAKGRVTTASEVTAPVGFRNRIINGDMRIDQRRSGASVTIASAVYTLDRWFADMSAASKYSVQRNAGSVTPPAGYTNYLGVTSLSSYSVSASDYFTIQQYVEGYNFSDLGFGSSSAKSITLSFWVRSSLTGTFGGAVSNGAQNRSYPFSYTISSADTWENKSITISGDQSGTWITDNGKGISVFFGLGVGSTNSGTAGAWSGSTFVSASGATSVVGTNGATFYITGVQLEAGSTATEFERRPFGTELALCQRYYYQYAPANQDFDQIASRLSTTTAWITMNTPVSMRTNPAVALGSAPFGRFVGYDSAFSSTTGTVSSIAILSTPSSNNAIQGLCTHAAITAAAGLYSFTFDTFGASSGIGLSAEL
jgi:hypothetical protein